MSTLQPQERSRLIVCTAEVGDVDDIRMDVNSIIAGNKTDGFEPVESSLINLSGKQFKATVEGSGIVAVKAHTALGVDIDQEIDDQQRGLDVMTLIAPVNERQASKKPRITLFYGPEATATHETLQEAWTEVVTVVLGNRKFEFLSGFVGLDLVQVK